MDEHTLDSALQRVADLTKEVVRGAREVSIRLVTKDKAGTVATGSIMAIDDATTTETRWADCTEPRSSEAR